MEPREVKVLIAKLSDMPLDDIPGTLCIPFFSESKMGAVWVQRTILTY